MHVICPVTSKECPYLKKLDSDVCPREHTCDAVKKSYSGMIQKPPAPKKFLVILFSVLLTAVLSICLVYFLVLDGNLSFLGLNKATSEITPSDPTVTAVITNEPTISPATPIPTLPAATSAPVALPPIPLTSEAATKPVRINIGNKDAEVKSVSLDEEQSMAVLPDALPVSWYDGSYIPGTKGNCIIFGYKYYNGMTGAFYNLDTLKKGDKIIFTLDNGTKIEQTVTEATIYRDGYLSNDILNVENTTARTVLISETGDIDSATKNYKDLIVVFAE